MEHNIRIEWADVFECSCGYKYEGPNRGAIENAHLYVNHFVEDDEDKSESEKFFAKASIFLDHVENGEVLFVPEETRLMTHVAFRIVINPSGGSAYADQKDAVVTPKEVGK